MAAYRQARSRDRVIFRLALPKSYAKNEGSSNVGWSRCGSWGLESFFNGPLAAQHHVIGGSQECRAGSHHTDATGALDRASAVTSRSPCFDLETVMKKNDKLWQQQNYAGLLKDVLSFSNPAHLQLSRPVSLISNRVHASPFASQAERLTLPVESKIPIGIHEGTTMAEQIVVKKINDILPLEGWERALEELNLQLCTELVSEVIRRQPNANAALSFFQWAKGQQGFQHSGRTYKDMLQKLMRHQDYKSTKLDTFHLIMNESLQNGWSPGVTIHTYLIDKYCKLGKIDEAFDHFNCMVSHRCAPNVVTYSSLIGGLIKVGRIQIALDVFEEMEGKKCYPNVITYSVLIHGLVKHRRLNQAWEIFERMKKQGCTPNLITYSTLIDGVVREGKVEEILKLLDQMREARCIPGPFIYGTVINHFVKAGKLQEAWDLFVEMNQNGLEPNLFVYTPIMTSLGRAGKWEQAQELLETMKVRKCVPDAVTYSALIAGFVRAGKWKDGLKVLDQMEANGCKPNEVIYTILMDALVRAKRAGLAQDLFNRMVANGCTTTMYTEESLEKVLARIRGK